MAMNVSQSIIGVDVAKAEVVVYQTETDELKTVPNNKAELKAWLKTLPAGSGIAIEATNIYHLDTVNLAHSMGHMVYVVDGYRLKHYRESTGGRAKTDPSDARLLARYLKNEQADLRVWNPPPKIYTKLQSLLRRRAALVKMRVALNQSWAGEPLLKASSKSIAVFLERHEALIEKRLLDSITEAGLLHQVKRCQAVEGIGFFTAVALTMAFQRGEFESADAYIAFLGMDLRAADSGQKHGRRSLSKKGDGEIRRLLHNAASAGIRSQAWKALYQGYLARGLKTTQALVIIARKLARIAFSLMKNLSEYQSKAVLGGAPKP